jgi:hypothetical protein
MFLTSALTAGGSASAFCFGGSRTRSSSDESSALSCACSDSTPTAPGLGDSHFGSVNRMRDAVIAAFPQADQVPSNDRAKRWRLAGNVTQPLGGITAYDLTSLDNAASILVRENLLDQADELRGVASKIRATLAAELMRKIDPDLGALAEAEGIAMRPGPRPVIASSLFATMRTAIKSCRKVSFSYRGRMNGKDDIRTVRPLGFLYGHRHYLVALKDEAAEPGSDNPGVRFFSLPQISKLRLLPESFDRDPEFNLAQFVAHSFGVYEEAPVDVVWRFSA